MASSRRSKERQLPVNHDAGNLAGCRRHPLPGKPCRQVLEPRPVLGLQRNLLNLRCSVQGRAPACRANPTLQLSSQRVQADRRAMNIFPGHDSLSPERLGDHVRAYRSERRINMSNCARRAARNFQFACHTRLLYASYSLIRKNQDPSGPLNSTTTTSWFVSRPKRWRNSRSSARCATSRSGLM